MTHLVAGFAAGLEIAAFSNDQAGLKWNSVCSFGMSVSRDHVPPITARALNNGEEPSGEIRKLSTLLEASQALLKERSLEAGLRQVLEILDRHQGAIRSRVVLLDEHVRDVELETSAGDTQPG